jgi:hypothetical protein
MTGIHSLDLVTSIAANTGRLSSVARLTSLTAMQIRRNAMLSTTHNNRLLMQNFKGRRREELRTTDHVLILGTLTQVLID